MVFLLENVSQYIHLQEKIQFEGPSSFSFLRFLGVKYEIANINTEEPALYQFEGLFERNKSNVKGKFL